MGPLDGPMGALDVPMGRATLLCLALPCSRLPYLGLPCLGLCWASSSQWARLIGHPRCLEFQVFKAIQLSDVNRSHLIKIRRDQPFCRADPYLYVAPSRDTPVLLWDENALAVVEHRREDRLGEYRGRQSKEQRCHCQDQRLSNGDSALFITQKLFEHFHFDRALSWCGPQTWHAATCGSASSIQQGNSGKRQRENYSKSICYRLACRFLLYHRDWAIRYNYEGDLARFRNSTRFLVPR